MARTPAARSGSKNKGGTAAADKPSGRRGTRAKAAEPEPQGNARERAAEESAARRAAKEEANAILGAKVFELREERELSWGEIAEELGYGDGNATGILQFRYEEELVRLNPRLRITARNDDELASKIQKARDNDLLSWAKIMARTGLGLGRCRTLYEEAGGTALGNRIGKGGRFPGGVNPDAKPAPKGRAKAAAAKPATKPAVKAASKPATSSRARRSRAS